MSKYKFYITHNAVTTEVFPLYDKIKYAWKKDVIRFRKECKTDFTFINNPKKLIYDFNTILAIENGSLRCDIINFEIKISCDKGATYTSHWLGSFSINDGRFDLNKCTYKVNPKIIDKYSCIINSQDKEVNLVESGPLITIEMYENQVTVEYTWGFNVTLAGWTNVHTAFVLIGEEPYQDTLQIYFFAREFSTTNKIAGVSFPPSADPNWALLNTTLTTATYTRPYVGGVVEVEEVFTIDMTGECSTAPPPPAPVNLPGFGTYTYVASFDFGTSTCQSFFIAIPINGLETYTQFRTLYNALSYLISKNCPEITGIISDFFEWNPIGDSPGYIAGINYVTGVINTVSKVAISQKSDIVDPNAFQKATKGLITFKKLMAQMSVIFNVDWFIDGSGNFRIEHEKYFTNTLGFNSAIAPHSVFNIANKIYSYKKDSMPNSEGFKFMEADGIDFTGRDINYSGTCVSNDAEGAGRKEYVADLITTDVNFIQSQPGEINKLGFVIVAYYNDGFDNIIHQEAGRISGNVLNNAHLSIANLNYNFHRHGRVLLNGNMNGVDEVFFTAIKNKVQSNVKLQICCGETFDPTGILIQTELGQGEIETAEEENNIITLQINL